jgi:transitional endoplasmic reticulum ATPase
MKPAKPWTAPERLGFILYSTTAVLVSLVYALLILLSGVTVRPLTAIHSALLVATFFSIGVVQIKPGALSYLVPIPSGRKLVRWTERLLYVGAVLATVVCIATAVVVLVSRSDLLGRSLPDWHRSVVVLYSGFYWISATAVALIALRSLGVKTKAGTELIGRLIVVCGLFAVVALGSLVFYPLLAYFAFFVLAASYAQVFPVKPVLANLGPTGTPKQFAETIARRVSRLLAVRAVSWGSFILAVAVAAGVLAAQPGVRGWLWAFAVGIGTLFLVSAVIQALVFGLVVKRVLEVNAIAVRDSLGNDPGTYASVYECLRDTDVSSFTQVDIRSLFAVFVKALPEPAIAHADRNPAVANVRPPQPTTSSTPQSRWFAGAKSQAFGVRRVDGSEGKRVAEADKSTPTADNGSASRSVDFPSMVPAIASPEDSPSPGGTERASSDSEPKATGHPSTRIGCLSCGSSIHTTKPLARARLEALVDSLETEAPPSPLQVLLPGEWRTAVASDAIRLLDLAAHHIPGLGQLLSGREASVYCIRTWSPSFYPGWYLVDLRVARRDNSPEMVPFLAGSDRAIALLGTSPPIHEKNAAVAGIELDSDVQTSDYLRFFCALVHGDDGPFRIVESAAHFDTLPDIDLHLVEDRVRPLTFLDQNRDPGVDFRLVRGIVYYSTQLFEADFKVLRSGKVELLSNRRILGDLPAKPFSLARFVCEDCLMWEPAPPIESFPESVDEMQAVQIAYRPEIQETASVLRSGLSVLVYCDKLVTSHLWRSILDEAVMKPSVIDGTEVGSGKALDEDLSRFRDRMKTGAAENEVMVLANLDLLGGGGHRGFTSDAAREVAQLLYRFGDRLLLAFADPCVEFPEVLARRFSIRRTIQGVPSWVKNGDGRKLPLGEALLSWAERDQVAGLDAATFYKYVAGMNPIEVRHAIRYALREARDGAPLSAKAFYAAIQQFKTRASTAFEVPDVKFEDIGGYEDVKETLIRALEIMEGAYRLPNEALRKELIPKGFILHGPPGTGKTYLAKAVAYQMNANVVVVSGPEVVNMYLGESERRIRELFAEARRNAPSVLIFDEFDAIAGQRSGDGGSGSRAQNAMVAQILTEMDGFRPEVQMLVIGTTNRIDIVDEALLRPSRFQSLAIGLPDADARRDIARIHARRFGIDVEPALIEQIVKSTENFNGDEIRSLFRDVFVARHTGGTRLGADGGEVSDAFLFGRLVREVRNRLEEEQNQSQRRTTIMRVLTDGPSRSHTERGRQAVPGMVEITPEAG